MNLSGSEDVNLNLILDSIALVFYLASFIVLPPQNSKSVSLWCRNLLILVVLIFFLHLPSVHFNISQVSSFKVVENLVQGSLSFHSAAT